MTETAAVTPTPRALVRALEDRAAALARERDDEAAQEALLEAAVILPRLTSLLKRVDLAQKLGHFQEADTHDAALVDGRKEYLWKRDLYLVARMRPLVNGLGRPRFAIELIEARTVKPPDDEEALRTAIEAIKGSGTIA